MAINEFLQKTSSPIFGLESRLRTSNFGVCQKYDIGQNKQSINLRQKYMALSYTWAFSIKSFITKNVLQKKAEIFRLFGRPQKYRFFYLIKSAVTKDQCMEGFQPMEVLPTNGWITFHKVEGANFF